MRRLIVLLALLFAAWNSHAGDFVLNDTQGKTHKLSDYQGKWVLVNFWATWCSPCLDEIPELIALYETHKDKDLVVIGVALDYPDPKQVTAFAESMLISYPMVLGSHRMAKQITGAYIYALPTTFLFNPWGDLVVNHTGAITRESIERYIKENSVK